jgi:hypothetical protein
MKQSEFRLDADLPPLSSSVSSLVERFLRDHEIHLCLVASALVELHPEYGDGFTPWLHEKATPDRRTIRGWLANIKAKTRGYIGRLASILFSCKLCDNSIDWQKIQLFRRAHELTFPADASAEIRLSRSESWHSIFIFANKP